MAQIFPSSVSLRQAVHDDKQLCYSIHKDAMQDVVGRIWGWDEASQLGYFDNSWDPAQTQIVLGDSQPAGLLVLERRPTELYIGRLEIYRHQQNRGVGTTVMRSLQSEARQLRVPLVLEVFEINDGALALYRRLGFRVTSTQGYKVHMRWDPSE